MDGNPDWLRQLGEFRQIFKERLDEARQQANSENERNALKMIASEYQQYVFKKDRVIELYEAGERAIGSQIHPEVRRHFASVLELCEKYKSLHRDRIANAKAASQLEAARLRIIAAVAMLISFILAVLLALVLAKQILGPVRQLALMAIRDPDIEKSRDEVKALSRGVRGLIERMDTFS